MLGIAAVVILVVGLIAVYGVTTHNRPTPSARGGLNSASGSSAGSGGGSSVAAGGTGSSGASASASASAVNAVNTLLGGSEKTRSSVQSAVTSVGACQSVRANARKLREAASSRESLAGQAMKIQAAAMANGSQLISELHSALTDSALADRDFAAWATLHENCRGSVGPDAHYRSGFHVSRLANTHKSAFIRLWAPIASANGLSLPGDW